MVGFIIGLIVGGIFGIFIMCVISSDRESDYKLVDLEEFERWNKEISDKPEDKYV